LPRDLAELMESGVSILEAALSNLRDNARTRRFL